MATTTESIITLVTMTCPTCGIVYGLPERYQQSKREHGGSWNCPNGHPLCYDEAIKSEQDRLRDRLKEAQETSNYHERRAAEKSEEIGAQKRTVSALKGQRTKLRKRIAHGVCPCCTRHFDNLEKHIATKHPDYKPVSV